MFTTGIHLLFPAMSPMTSGDKDLCPENCCKTYVVFQHKMWLSILQREHVFINLLFIVASLNIELGFC